jgi:hypothetical protein
MADAQPLAAFDVQYHLEKGGDLEVGDVNHREVCAIGELLCAERFSRAAGVLNSDETTRDLAQPRTASGLGLNAAPTLLGPKLVGVRLVTAHADTDHF